MDGDKKKFQEKKQNLNTDLIIFQQLLDQIDVDIRLGAPLRRMSSEFKALDKYVEVVNKWIFSGNAVYGKPFDVETDNSMSRLYDFFDRYK